MNYFIRYIHKKSSCHYNGQPYDSNRTGSPPNDTEKENLRQWESHRNRQQQHCWGLVSIGVETWLSPSYTKKKKEKRKTFRITFLFLGLPPAQCSLLGGVWSGSSHRSQIMGTFSKLVDDTVCSAGWLAGCVDSNMLQRQAKANAAERTATLRAEPHLRWRVVGVLVVLVVDGDECRPRERACP